MKIGVFDSGVGGLTVLKELRTHFPNADYVYYGDTANVPYGTKSLEQIRKLSRAAANVLKGKDLDVLVVACNTASSLALDTIREVMDPVPVIGMVEPGVTAVLQAIRTRDENSHPTILILGTRATIGSGIYGKELRAHLLSAAPGIPIIEQACPLLVPMIEEGWVDHPILKATLLEYLRPALENHTPGVALMACTHYPWIQPVIESLLPGWQVINSASAVVQFLEQNKFRPTSTDRAPVTEWIYTDPKAVPRFALTEMKI